MFTYLTNDEKLDSLIYMEKFISKDETIAELQYGSIERVLDLIIKEPNYAYQQGCKISSVFGFFGFLEVNRRTKNFDHRLSVFYEKGSVFSFC